MTTFETGTHSAVETFDLATRIGSILRAGDVVALSGDLGAGKTVFAKGIARSLGVIEDVVSPTFTLVREYDARLPLVHVDVYRLDHLQELHDVGFDEFLGDTAVTVVEWGDRVSALLPPERLDVRLRLGERDDDRIVTIQPAGGSWAARCDALAGIVSRDESGT